MSASTVWDPFDGEINVRAGTTKTASSTPFASIVRHLESIATLGILAGFAILFYAIITGTNFIPGIAVVTACFGLLFGGQAIGGLEKNRLIRLNNAVIRLGFSFGGKIADQRLSQIRHRASALFKLRVGGSIPLIVTDEFWGRTDKDIPFWAGVSVVASTSVLGGPRANVAIDPKTVHGETTFLVVGYSLDRDTRVHVEILPEFLTAAGPFDRDIKTESTEFNRHYNIRLTPQDGEKVDERQSTTALLQVLTPAFQATLIGLAESYAARVIIDRDTVFFGGYRNVQSTDETALAEALQTTLADFAHAATSFKKYAE